MLDNASYDPWIETLNSSTQQIAFVQSMVGLGFGWLIGLLFRFIASDIETHANSTKVKIDRRRLITTDRSDLIEPLLKLHESDKLPMPKVISNAGTLLAAGSETTATLLTGVTYLLCKTPEALKKVTQEVRAAYKSEDEITLISVSKLDYMLASLDEAMRLYPPVAMGLPRTIRQGGDQVAGHFLPEGTVAAVYQWAANRSTMNFHNPLAYRPERFLSDRPAGFDRDRREAMQPFSVGPRNCVGKNLAIAEMRQILARILFSFDIELVDPNLDWLHVDYQKSFFLWDKPPMEVYLTPV
ncbi:hypothetical protein PFICI_10503 [Pestalotiopsis fici W106-1]|uniref:Isotrichodermin C-15 hydroxylase n=1 Tax=Pestalotiopsis fici (strain W106-1 / CGMCC3.15140) TaxID=1229662 RepID=W3WZX7_PESFW|nr:uncharacterized protein PFICI_10503 [Pestalotiopsis fici W106-1]ETS78441.1 hypothetical protein PFICI_10503 [Pestalotiopsis fici W106-1]